MSEEIRDIKDSISFLADTQRILSENILLQQQQFNEFQQILNASREESELRHQEAERRLNNFLEEGRRNRQESERRFEASQAFEPTTPYPTIGRTNHQAGRTTC
jgi:predicted HicB family RNase H-like nuclease